MMHVPAALANRRPRIRLVSTSPLTRYAVAPCINLKIRSSKKKKKRSGATLRNPEKGKYGGKKNLNKNECDMQLP
jgi:hypothetical protein